MQHSPFDITRRSAHAAPSVSCRIKRPGRGSSKGCIDAAYCSAGPLVVGRPATPDHGSSLPTGSPHLSGAPVRRRNPLRLPRRRRQPPAAMMPTRHARLTCSRWTERAAWRGTSRACRSRCSHEETVAAKKDPSRLSVGWGLQGIPMFAVVRGE
jgi:hypothetical protein